MAQQFSYNYAVIDPSTGMCIEVYSVSENRDDYPDHIAIDECNTDYLLKYYNAANGKWYEDAAFTVEWSPEA